MGRIAHDRLHYMTYDIKYMCKGTTIPFMVHKTDFVDKLIELMAGFYFTDLVELKT